MQQAKEVDPYLIDRIPIAKNMDHAYLLEVEGLCPLCGKNLLATKGRNKSKLYQIAHIYPNSPSSKQVKELYGLERLGTNCEDFENKIALCKDCHGLYDDDVTKDEYLNLVKIKRELLSIANAKEVISHQPLEDEIILVINSLSTVDMNTLKEVNLKYNGVKIADKFESNYTILKSKIESYVCSYYFFIREIFQQLEQNDQINFNIIANEIKTSFLKCENEKIDKSDIFNTLVNWLRSKIKARVSLESCEIVVCFFVQNCEVFHEIT
ncbi:hypothetical protein SRRS_14900 [Sporomusa rhizae]|uniref:ABC-three component system protein n=1 Tax=Sporomusa rhizae TaxID=357999 RepID=UPI003529E4C2